MINYYRITYKNMGIYEALKQEVDFETWKYFLKLENVNWLPKPPTYENANRSYFKEKGFKIWKEKVLPFMLQYLDENEINIILTASVGQILYEDEYQIVVEEDTTGK